MVSIFQHLCSRATRQTTRIVITLLTALIICLTYRKKLKLASRSPHKFTDPCPDSFPTNFYSNISKSLSKTIPLEPKLRDWCFKSHTLTCNSVYAMENDTVYLDYPANSCTYRPIKYQWDNVGPKIDSAWFIKKNGKEDNVEKTSFKAQHDMFEIRCKSQKADCIRNFSKNDRNTLVRSREFLFKC